MRSPRIVEPTSEITDHTDVRDTDSRLDLMLSLIDTIRDHDGELRQIICDLQWANSKLEDTVEELRDERDSLREEVRTLLNSVAHLESIVEE